MATSPQLTEPQVQTPLTPPASMDLETPEQKYARLYSGPTHSQPLQAPTPSQTPSVAAPVSIPPEVTEPLLALRSELAELRNRVPVSPPIPTVPKEGWVDKIRQGDFDGAEKVLTDSVRQSIVEEVKTRAYQDSLAATQVQLAIDRHVEKVRRENPDLIRFERYLEAPVNARVEEARRNGRIRSSQEFVKEYTSAVDAEVNELRNMGLQYRADGKQEAMTRQTAVTQAFTPAPQQVGDHTAPAPQLSQQGESNQDYFARRSAQSQRQHGL